MSEMLLIRHAIGSRLFYQTKDYEIKPKGDMWIISVSISEEEAQQVVNFREELNLFDVEENQKTWYYSSNADVKFNMVNHKLIISADHKTVYPV